MLRMQQFPGIVFVDGPAGRRAHLAGTGLDVWEVIGLLREYSGVAKLREDFPHLSPMAIQIARAYAKAYPEEIGTFLELNDQSPQQLSEQLPWLEGHAPKWHSGCCLTLTSHQRWLLGFGGVDTTWLPRRAMPH